MNLEHLTKKIQSGNESAFEELLEECYGMIYSYALKWSGNVIDAEDITQQSCIKLARNIHQFKFESKFTTWLYRLVINCAKDWQKVQYRHRYDSLDKVVEHPCLKDEENFQKVYLQQILIQLASFGEGYQETVLLVLGEGLNHKEAADILQVKESTVSWRIYQVRKRLNVLVEVCS